MTNITLGEGEGLISQKSLKAFVFTGYVPRIGSHDSAEHNTSIVRTHVKPFKAGPGSALWGGHLLRQCYNYNVKLSLV